MKIGRLLFAALVVAQTSCKARESSVVPTEAVCTDESCPSFDRPRHGPIPVCIDGATLPPAADER